MSYRFDEFSDAFLLKLLALKSLRVMGFKALVDPEAGINGSISAAPVTDDLIDTLVELLGEIRVLRNAADDPSTPPLTRKQLLAMVAQLEAQFSADVWGPMATSVISLVPDQVIQSTAARSLLHLSNFKAWCALAPRLGIDQAKAKRAYQQAGGDSQYAAQLGLHGLSALDTLNDRYHIPGMKSWIASATKTFAAKANQPYWRARTADLADAVAELVSGVRALKAMAG